MVHHEVAGNGELAGGVAVVDPMARLAELFVCVVRPRRPVPTSLVEHRAALRTHRGLRQLESGLVGIVDVLTDQPVAPGLPGYLARVLHFTLPAKCQAVAERSMADVQPGAVDVNQSSIPPECYRAGCRRRTACMPRPEEGATP